MKSTERFFDHIINVIISYPRAILVVFLCVTAVLGWQAQKFRIDTSADVLLMKDNKDYLRTQIVDRQFSPYEFLFIVYKPKNEAVFSQQTLTTLQKLCEDLVRLKRVDSAVSLHNVPIFSQMEDGITSDTDLSQWTAEKKHYSPEILKNAFRDHPLYENVLINKEQTVAAIQVVFTSDKELEKIYDRIVSIQKERLTRKLTDPELTQIAQLKEQAKPIEEALDKTRTAEIIEIRHLLKGYETDGEFYLGGAHVLSYQLIKIIKSDLVVFGSAIGIIICLLLFLIFRSLKWIFIPVVCCLCSILSTIGLFGLFGFKTTVISSNFMVLQLILTLAIVIHLIVQYRQDRFIHPEWDEKKLVKETLLKKGRPCFYAGVTTSVGFASLVFSGIQPVITFGWMMIFATFFSLGVSLVLFPSMMTLFAKEPASEPPSIPRKLLGVLQRISLFHGAAITIVCILLFMVACGGLFFLSVENSFINYFHKSTRVFKELSFIDRYLGGSTSLDIIYTISAQEKKKDLIMSADTVLKIQQIHAALEKYPAVGKMLSIVTFTTLAKQLNENRPLTEYELTALFWTMENSLRAKLLGAFFAPKENQIRCNIRIKDSTPGLNRANLLKNIKKDLETLGISKEQYMLTNLFVLYQGILQRLFSSQILTIAIVFLVLLATFYLLFRSIKIACIGMIQNVLTIACVLGAMGWLGVPLDLMTITIAAIAMGIAVDDTIHYIHRYLDELKHDTAQEAIKLTHSSVGHSIVYSSVIIIIGFSSLLFSNFMPSVFFGLFTGLAMIVALLLNLTLLPFLLQTFVHTA